MAEYPKGVTTNDGLRMYFKSAEEEIAAYKKEPGMFHDVPAGCEAVVIHEVTPPVEVVPEFKPVEPVVTAVPVIEKPMMKKTVGRSKLRW